MLGAMSRHESLKSFDISRCQSAALAGEHRLRRPPDRVRLHIHRACATGWLWQRRAPGDLLRLQQCTGARIQDKIAFSLKLMSLLVARTSRVEALACLHDRCQYLQQVAQQCYAFDSSIGCVQQMMCHIVCCWLVVLAAVHFL